ncbi:MAG: nuclear transport factor 2 family protein [Gemmatimonadota bacterium]|nr:nuclear transport factor 2 family protein [Gemmatimonadota bacterium]
MKRRTWILASLAALTVVPVASGRELAGQSSLAADVEGLLRGLGDAYAAGDAVAVTALFTSDARLFPPGQPLVSGRAALGERYEEMFAGGGAAVRFAALETREGDGWAVVQGSGELPATGLTVKFLMIVEREGGALKIARLIWNDDREG